MSKSYSSPLCSCIICREVKSAKGIHSHFRINHSENGLENHKIRAKIGVIKGSYTTKRNTFIKNIILWKNYYTNPSICPVCLEPKDWFRRNNKFCSQSCAAVHTNKNREESVRLKQRETLVKTLSLKPKSYKQTIVRVKPEYCKFSYCVICNTTIQYKHTKTCSDTCLKLHLSNMASARQTHPQNGKSILYNGVKLGSSYELRLAISLDENNIVWIRPKPLKYKDPSGKIRNYFPDFYLPDYDIYLDPKNDFLINQTNPETGFKDTDKIKWVETENNVKIIILNKHQLSWNSIEALL